MEEKTQDLTNEPLVRGFTEPTEGSIFSTKVIIFLVIVAIFGVGSGYFLSSSGGKIGSVDIGGKIGESSVSKGAVVGSSDLKTFKDITEGVLKEGGIDGEGQFHLVRPGGESQNVYLTSSIVDLSKFVGRKIKIWGETNKAQKAGWLMDVGRVEVLE